MRYNHVMNSLSKAWLFTADISSLANDPDLEAMALEMVSDGRRDAALRISNDHGRCLSLGAEILLRAGLEAAGVCTAERQALSFEYGKNGKPYLRGENVFFNISHSGDMVICALAPFEVGCDIEQIREGSRTRKIAARYFTEEEQAFVVSQPDETEAFYRMWTHKESFMKVTGMGLSLSLADFCIHMPKEDRAGTQFGSITVTQNVDDRQYSFYEYDGISGYRVSVCGAAGSVNPMIQEISLEKYIFNKLKYR